MALDWITIGISLVVFVIYIVALFLLVEIKRRVNKKAGIAVIFFMLAIFFLIIRRLQQIFIQSSIVISTPYFPDIVTLIFATLFSLGIFFLYKAIKDVGGSPGNGKAVSIFRNYRKKFG